MDTIFIDHVITRINQSVCVGIKLRVSQTSFILALRMTTASSQTVSKISFYSLRNIHVVLVGFRSCI